ncbi:MAG: alpha/beta fold hydrolase [Actinomycetota bacterium]|nr:alpha/beta fold hydrolase [Actinomycetota bacterium]
MSEQITRVGDVELCYEAFGDPSDRPLLLIMGLGTQMIAWHEDFCAELAGRGFYVIRYDNRDVGRSTRFDQVRPPKMQELLTRRPRALAYTLPDMAGDAAGLLDALGLESAHVVGASMGGMIGQVLTVEHPERVRSLVSIMSTTGSRFVGQPAAAVYPFFMKPMPKSKEEYLERGLKLWKVIGSPGFPRGEDEILDLLERSYDRGLSPAGTMRQLAAIVASGNRTRDLRRVSVPTLVVHGTKDKMIRVSGGKATARAIPDARLELIDGMGHDMPRAVWPRLMGGIEATAERAAEPAAAAA